MQPIFADSQFPGAARAPRIGQAGPRATTPVEPTTWVDMRLTDGTTVRVASKLTLLKVMEACRQRGQTYVALNEDVSLFWAGFAKGFLLENTLLNQRLCANFAVSYDSGYTTWVHRSLATSMSMKDALVSCGATVLGQLSTNSDFERENLPIKIFDWNFRALTSEGSKLNDLAVGQLLYDWD